MRVSDFRFDLPDRLIATKPVEPRDAARLLVHDRATRQTAHRVVRDLPDLLDPGDLLVLNDTRVLPHRLVGRRATGGRVDVLVLQRLADGVCEGFVKPSKKLRVGDPPWILEGRIALTAEPDGLATADGEAGRKENSSGGRVRFRLADLSGEGVDVALEAVGRAPLPPYIARRDGVDDEDVSGDRERYQTVYAARDGAVAAPTAGLHFTPELLERIAARGVETTTVTLHVGEGTFSPIRVEDVADHEMHTEWFELSDAAAAAVRATRERGGRVVAVGTTAARTLETCGGEDGLVRAGSGETNLFLYPGGERSVRVVDALFTNFHLPESTLIMLVSAFAGLEETLGLYREAIEREYRFYSFGDAMLLR